MTKPQSLDVDNNADNEPSLATRNKEVIELLASSFLLHQGKISDEAWLEVLCKAVGCDSAGCVRWTRGNPEYSVISAYGEHREMPTGWKNWVDHVICSSTKREPGFLEDFAAASLEPERNSAKDLEDSHMLLAVVDWEPACMVIPMARNADQPAWTHFERKHVLRVLGYVRESINVHKELDRRRYISGLASDILNSSPRGMIAVTEDGVIQMANRMAQNMLDGRDGIANNHGKLTFSDKKACKALAEHLQNMSHESGEGLPEMDWNLVAKRPSGAPGYQLIMGSLRLRDWNIESRTSDRVGIVYVHDLSEKTRPTTSQLRDFYGFTEAQARLAATVYEGTSIADAAKMLNISINTARSHMRGIYAKAGVKTQAELITLLASGLKTYGKRKS